MLTSHSSATRIIYILLLYTHFYHISYYFSYKQCDFLKKCHQDLFIFGNALSHQEADENNVYV